MKQPTHCTRPVSPSGSKVELDIGVASRRLCLLVHFRGDRVWDASSPHEAALWPNSPGAHPHCGDHDPSTLGAVGVGVGRGCIYSLHGEASGAKDGGDWMRKQSKQTGSHTEAESATAQRCESAHFKRSDAGECNVRAQPEVWLWAQNPLVWGVTRPSPDGPSPGSMLRVTGSPQESRPFPVLGDERAESKSRKESHSRAVLWGFSWSCFKGAVLKELLCKQWCSWGRSTDKSELEIGQGLPCWPGAE